MTNFFDQPDRDQVIMARDVTLHAVETFIQSLDNDGMTCLLTILDLVNKNERNNGFMAGMIHRLQSDKLGVCSVCGKKHDAEEELHTMTEGAGSMGADDYSAKLLTYNLYKSNEGVLYCNGCGTRYVSLEDRMIKEPGIAGCNGCMQKSKWG